jgi:hypothetical protein
MSAGNSGGLLAAILGEAHTSISEDRPEPPQAKCRWDGCRTFLRIKNRGPLRSRKAAEEAPVESEQAARVYQKQERVSKNLKGLCDLHKRMVQDYDLGLTSVRPPFYPPPKPVEGKRRKHDLPDDD